MGHVQKALEVQPKASVAGPTSLGIYGLCGKASNVSVNGKLDSYNIVSNTHSLLLTLLISTPTWAYCAVL